MASRISYTPAGGDGTFDNLKDQQGGNFLQRANDHVGGKFKFVLIILSIITCTIILAFACLLGLTIAVAQIIPFVSPHDNLCKSIQLAAHGSLSLQGDNPAVNHCGNSSEQARVNNCIFDLSLAAWFLPSCFDAELNADFLALGPWNFYLSNSSEWDLRKAPAEQRVLLPDIDAIADSAESMWTDRRYHIVHCAFLWKSMHRAVQRGQKTEETLYSDRHAEHCSNVLANTSVPVDAINTRVEISFPKC